MIGSKPGAEYLEQRVNFEGGKFGCIHDLGSSQNENRFGVCGRLALRNGSESTSSSSGIVDRYLSWLLPTGHASQEEQGYTG